MEISAILMENVVKKFEDVVAVNGVSLQVAKGNFSVYLDLTVQAKLQPSTFYAD